MGGYIKLHRKVMEHWVAKSNHPYSQLEAWIDIIISVNQEAATIMIGGEKFSILRGQSLHSLETWAKRWRWDKSKVRRYLEKLQKDEMIVINNEKKSTRLTVCNYATYNPKRNATDTAPTPNNNILSKDSIKIKKDAFKDSLKPYLETYGKDTLNEFYKYWVELTPSKTKMRFEDQKYFELPKRLSTWKRKSVKPAGSKFFQAAIVDESENENFFK